MRLILQTLVAAAFFAALTAFFILASIGNANAQEVPEINGRDCDFRDAMVAQLSENFAERPTTIGLSYQGHLTEIWQSEDGRTWSIIQHNPNGISCLVDVGEDMEQRTFVAGRPS